MKRAELEKLEEWDWKEPLPLLDQIYVIPQRSKHDSGYRRLAIYGMVYENHKVVWAKKITDCSDVIDFQISPEKARKISNYDFSFATIMCDCDECNVLRYWASGKFKVESALSSFMVTVVEDK